MVLPALLCAAPGLPFLVLIMWVPLLQTRCIFLPTVAAVATVVEDLLGRPEAL
jgi:hypothetical protein